MACCRESPRLWHIGPPRAFFFLLYASLTGAPVQPLKSPARLWLALAFAWCLRAWIRTRELSA